MSVVCLPPIFYDTTVEDIVYGINFGLMRLDQNPWQNGLVAEQDGVLVGLAGR